MSKPTDRQVIAWGLQQLQAGRLASTLAGAMMVQFGITAERARKLAGAAIDEWKRRKADV